MQVTKAWSHRMRLVCLYVGPPVTRFMFQDLCRTLAGLQVPAAVQMLAAEVAADGPAMQMWREWRRQQPDPPAADREADPGGPSEGRL